MKFQFSEKKVRLPGNVHAYAEKKVMKLARFFDEDAEALVTFAVEKDRNIAELTVHGAGTWFRAKESTSDMFASIDAAVSTIEGQIRKNKTRLARRLKQDAFVRSVDIEETSFAAEESEADLSIHRIKEFRQLCLCQQSRKSALIEWNVAHQKPPIQERTHSATTVDKVSRIVCNKMKQQEFISLDITMLPPFAKSSIIPNARKHAIHHIDIFLNIEM